jgi:hypothetical protein
VEFVNFIATLITSRMVRKAGDAGLLDTMTYGDLMEDLSVLPPGAPLMQQGRRSPTTNTGSTPFLPCLRCWKNSDCPNPLQKTPKKRGRPKGKVPKPEKPKRPRGRPRKNAVAHATEKNL